MASYWADVHPSPGWLPGPSSARETEALNRALQVALYGSASSSSTSVAVSSPVNSEPTISTSASDVTPLPPSSPTAPPKQKKRKSRAKGPREVTYITTDAANFRRRVQEATGLQAGRMVKPAPQLPVGAPAAAALPTPAFFFSREAAAGSLCAAEPVAEEGQRIEFDRFQSCYFPTLESWTVM